MIRWVRCSNAWAIVLALLIGACDGKKSDNSICSTPASCIVIVEYYAGFDSDVAYPTPAQSRSANGIVLAVSSDATMQWRDEKGVLKQRKLSVIDYDRLRTLVRKTVESLCDDHTRPGIVIDFPRICVTLQDEEKQIDRSFNMTKDDFFAKTPLSFFLREQESRNVNLERLRFALIQLCLQDEQEKAS